MSYRTLQSKEDFIEATHEHNNNLALSMYRGISSQMNDYFQKQLTNLLDSQKDFVLFNTRLNFYLNKNSLKVSYSHPLLEKDHELFNIRYFENFFSLATDLLDNIESHYESIDFLVEQIIEDLNEYASNSKELFSSMIDDLFSNELAEYKNIFSDDKNMYLQPSTFFGNLIECHFVFRFDTAPSSSFFNVVEKLDFFIPIPCDLDFEEADVDSLKASILKSFEREFADFNLFYHKNLIKHPTLRNSSFKTKLNAHLYEIFSHSVKDNIVHLEIGKLAFMLPRKDFQTKFSRYVNSIQL